MVQAHRVQIGHCCTGLADGDQVFSQRCGTGGELAHVLFQRIGWGFQVGESAVLVLDSLVTEAGDADYFASIFGMPNRVTAVEHPHRDILFDRRSMANMTAESKKAAT